MQERTLELYHHGVKGMKWGVRKARSNVADKKAALKTAKKEYNKSFNKAYNRALGAYSPIKKRREENAARWKDVADKAKVLDSAKKDYKTARVDAKKKSDNAKAEFKAQRRSVSEKRRFGNKLATNLLAGAFANRTYNSVIAAGGTKNGARVATALASIGGPFGHLAVSSLYTRAAGRGDLEKID